VLAHQGRFAEAARWYAAVFAAHPHLLAGSPTGHRYYAAWAAVLAGCGQGRDASGLDPEGRAGFRRQALAWLRAELEAQRRLLEREPAREPWMIAGRLKRWLGEPGFDGVREADALGRLPAAERQAWQQLWADVAATLARAEGTTPPGPEAGSRGPLPDR
jgi:serine/threonine-protein kinase